MDKDVADLIVGVLGGTGDQGRGLAHRFAAAGNPVIIGSRSAGARRRAAAAELGGWPIRGLANADAAAAADVVIVAVPWEGHGTCWPRWPGRCRQDSDRLRQPAGVRQARGLPAPGQEGSAAQQAAAVLRTAGWSGRSITCPRSCCWTPRSTTVDLDVMVLGDDREATDLVQALAARIPGVRGVYAGRLRNCGQVEALTANLVSINRRYKAHAGLRVTDI